MTTTSELAHLFRALKAPAAARAPPKLADRAREKQWSYDRFAEALLSTEVASRDSDGGEARIKQARFPARKTLEEFDFTFQRSVRRQVVEHLGQLDFLHAKDNVVLLGPPGTGKSHLAIAVSIRACLAGHRVAFATATEWVARLSEAKRHNALDTELRRLSFIPLLVVDQVGYIPFDPEAANLMFSLVSARYERASLIVTSNKAILGLGRDLRRRDHRRRDDRPARPPRRDPLAQGRQLPPARQGPRHPAGRPTRRNRLTDHPRRSGREPQNGATRPDASADAPQPLPATARTRWTPLRLALRARLRGAQRAHRSPQRAQPINPLPGGCVSTGAGAFSTGLDSGIGVHLRQRHGSALPAAAAPRRPGPAAAPQAQPAHALGHQELHRRALAGDATRGKWYAAHLRAARCDSAHQRASSHVAVLPMRSVEGP
jgi:DNA replication protein DnaC